MDAALKGIVTRPCEATRKRKFFDTSSKAGIGASGLTCGSQIEDKNRARRVAEVSFNSSNQPKRTQAVARSGEYHVGQEIAKGGMGAILAASDDALDRTVAMKVMLADFGASEDSRLRFIREAVVLARLEHPNIVPIHELGKDEQGRPFYTMKLVKGRTLQAILNSLRKGDGKTIQDFPLKRLLAIFRQVCDAMAFAHNRKVIHRDLKPENVMVGEFGETLVMDWGLAKILETNEAPPVSAPAESDPVPADDEDMATRQATRWFDDLLQTDAATGAGLTMDGAVMGSPQYMSPEQAEGNIGELDERSDIFSLGGILYAILTLRPPVEGKSVREVLENVKSGRITPPTHFNSGSSSTVIGRTTDGKPTDPALVASLPHCPAGRAPAPLSAVTMRALALAKDDRYPSVTALSQEIEQWQGGFATSAEDIGAAGQLALFIKRNKTTSVASGIAFLIVVVLTAGFLFRINEEKLIAAREAKDATAAKEEMEKERNAARQAEANAQIGLAEAALTTSNIRLLRTTLSKVPEDLRKEDWQYLYEQTKSGHVEITGREATKITAACPHPVRPSIFLILDDAGAMSLVNAATGERVHEYAHIASSKGDRAVAVSPDGQRIAVSDPSGIVILDEKTEDVLARSTMKGDFLSWSPDGRHLSYSAMDSPAGLLDAATGDELWKLPAIGDWKNWHRFLLFLSKTNEVLDVNQFRTAVLDRKTGKEIRRLATSGPPVLAAALSPDRKRLIVQRNGESMIRIWNLQGDQLQIFNTKYKFTSGIAFAPFGDMILALGNMTDSTRNISFGYLESGLTLGVRFVENEGALQTHPLSGEVMRIGTNARAWRFDNRRPWKILPEDSNTLWKFTFAGNDSWFVGPLHAQWRKRGPEIAKGVRSKHDTDRFFWNLDVDNNESYAQPATPIFNYYRTHYSSADGNRIVSFTWYDQIAVFDRTSDGKNFVKAFEGKFAEKAEFRIRAIDPTARQAWFNHSVWDVETRQKVFDLEIPEGVVVERVEWRPNGKSIIGTVVKKDPDDELKTERFVYRWEGESGTRQAIRPLPGSMNAMRISPDGKRVAVAGADKFIYVLDSESLNPLTKIRAHNKAITYLAWHPSLPILASTSADLSVKIWDLNADRLLETMWGPKQMSKWLDFSPSGKLLVCNAIKSSVFLWDMRDYLDRAAEFGGFIPREEPPPSERRTTTNPDSAVAPFAPAVEQQFQAAFEAGDEADAFALLAAPEEWDREWNLRWRRMANSIESVSAVNNRIDMPGKPEGRDYRLRFRHQVLQGNMGIGVILPMAGKSLQLELDAFPNDGWLTAIGNYRGDRQSNRKMATDELRFLKDKPNDVEIDIQFLDDKEKVQMTARLNGAPLAIWVGDIKDISLPDDLGGHTGRIGFRTRDTRCRLDRFTLQLLPAEGEGK